MTKKKFISKIVDNSIIKVDRRAKMLIFYLESGEFILVHLKMTGQLVYQEKTKIVIAGEGLATIKIEEEDVT